MNKNNIKHVQRPVVNKNTDKGNSGKVELECVYTP